MARKRQRGLDDRAISEIESRIRAQVVDRGIGQRALRRCEKAIDLHLTGGVSLELSYA